MSDEELAALVDAAAAGVDGVVRLYATAPVVAGIVRAVVGSDAASPSSTVTVGEGTRVTVNVGVAAAGVSGDVASAVADAVREVVGADADVHVRVSRIHA